MKNKSIVYKLFSINVIVFSIFIVILIGFQSIFFSEFYIKEKVKIIENNISNFSKRYLRSNWSLDDRRKEINHFIEQNNSVMIITDEEGNPKDLFMYEFHNSVMIVKDNNEKYYTVLIDDIMNSDNETKFEVKKGESIYVEGTQIDEEEFIIYPRKIESIGKTYLNESEIPEFIYEDDNNTKKSISNKQSKKIKATVVYSEAGTHVNEDIQYKKSLLMEYIYSWFYENKEKDSLKDNEVTSYYCNESNAGKQDMFIINPLIKKNGNREYIFVFTSLQPVDEAVAIMKKYYGYVFLLAILIVFILSFVYSKIISKPLININKIAKNMANLDFSTYCKVKSDDEMGNLSKSLNTLSKNLDNSLKELKEANEKLTEDIEKEKKQEQIRREFVASISHELKTPLGIMKGFAEGIKDGIYEDKKEYYLEVIIDEIEKMNELVLDMLELSKLEARVYKLNESNFDIKDILMTTNNKFKHLYQEKNLKVTLDIDSYEIYADRKKIEQVIVNLFSNAVRYSKNDGFIKIKTEAKDDDVYVYIENSDSHIPEDKIDKIWDRFYRLEKSRSRALGGTGLGLPIVKNILEMHKSKFGIRNTEDGVEFYFSLYKF